MGKTENIVVVLGIGFAALMLAQAVFRTGTVPMLTSEWSTAAKEREKHDAVEYAIDSFGLGLGLDWEGVRKIISADGALFDEAVKNGASEDTPGIIVNVGGVEGRPYVIIDDNPYYLSGR